MVADGILGELVGTLTTMDNVAAVPSKRCNPGLAVEAAGFVFPAEASCADENCGCSDVGAEARALRAPHVRPQRTQHRCTTRRTHASKQVQHRAPHSAPHQSPLLSGPASHTVVTACVRSYRPP